MQLSARTRAAEVMSHEDPVPLEEAVDLLGVVVRVLAIVARVVPVGRRDVGRVRWKRRRAPPFCQDQT